MLWVTLFASIVENSLSLTIGNQMSKKTSDDNGLEAIDVLAKRLKICRKCVKKCTKGVFGAPSPEGCPYLLERIVYEQR